VLAAIDLGTEKLAKYKLNNEILKYAKSYAGKQNCHFYACYTVHVSPILRNLGIVFSDETSH